MSAAQSFLRANRFLATRLALHRPAVTTYTTAAVAGFYAWIKHVQVQDSNALHHEYAAPLKEFLVQHSDAVLPFLENSILFGTATSYVLAWQSYKGSKTFEYELERYAAQGSRCAVHALGVLYEHGLDDIIGDVGIKKDLKKAEECYTALDGMFIGIQKDIERVKNLRAGEGCEVGNVHLFHRLHELFLFRDSQPVTIEALHRVYGLVVPASLLQ